MKLCTVEFNGGILFLVTDQAALQNLLSTGNTQLLVQNGETIQVIAIPNTQLAGNAGVPGNYREAIQPWPLHHRLVIN